MNVEIKQYNDESAEPDEEKYHEETISNGIEISVGWDRDYRNYTIYFPQIQIGKEASEKGVNDQIIRIGTDPDIAKRIYDFAVAKAKFIPDVYTLFVNVQRIIRDI